MQKDLGYSTSLDRTFFRCFFEILFLVAQSAQRCLQQGAGRQDQNLLRAIQGMPLQALVVGSLPLL